MRTLKLAAAVTVLLAWSFDSRAHLRRQATPLLFEVESVKPSVSGQRGPGSRALGCGGTDGLAGGDPTPLGRCVVRRMPLRLIIAFAYGFDITEAESRISGGPGWADSEMYDIEAKSEQPASSAQLRQMLQTLLKRRFGLEMRSVTREASGFALSRRDSGVSLEEAESGQGGGYRVRATGTLTSTSLSMAELASALSSILNTTVIDNTGLKGRYSINLSWAPDESQFRRNSGASQSGPSIFTALQEQLGLTLISQRVEIQRFTIDRAERPAPN